MPEICGDAALYCDPTEPKDMADKIWQTLNDKAVRQELIGYTQESVRRFSWERAARETLRVFEEIMA
jgi:glycosyltransferase involved in cell wall biosynthesis